MSDSTTYRESDSTKKKQSRFQYTLGVNSAIAARIIAKGPWWERSYMFVDLTAGPGRSSDGEPGSPLIFLTMMRNRQQQYEAHFYERDADTMAALRANVAQFERCNVVCGTTECHPEDHAEIVNAWPGNKNQYGMVYCDTSNAQIPVDVLKHLSIRYPKMDIVINIAFASYKRRCNLGHYVMPEDAIAQIGKKKWLTTPPEAKHQWTVLIGTNWDNYKEHKAAADERFYDIASPEGKEIASEIFFTKHQRQQTLFDIRGIPEASEVPRHPPRGDAAGQMGLPTL